ncbi:MAG: hypothetical protein ACR2HF_02415 [Methylococcaceae bacterium]
MTTPPPKKPTTPRRKRTVKKPAAEATKILASSTDYVLTSREAPETQPEAIAEVLTDTSALPPVEEAIQSPSEPDFKDLPPLVGEFISKQDWTETTQNAIPPGNGIRTDLSGEDIIKRVKHLNRSMGWILISAGVVGIVIPGIIGTPFVILGGLVLWPGNEKMLNKWRKGHHAGFVDGALRQVNRYLDDVERRYPGKGQSTS